MVKNCDNCGNQDILKFIQDCNTFGYPLFADCENWKHKNEEVQKELEKEELARKLCWR
ncbi:MAG: hypothetical protein IJZ36_02475 [Bacilli bacterium]|nr:hypothetical protein [Bacilli bacterium]